MRRWSRWTASCAGTAERALARFGSQLQTGDHQTIAGVLGLKPEQVQVETMLAGGSFGRRAQTTMHLAAELAHAAKAIGPGRPVKLVWTREDDIRGGYYRPLFVHRMRGAVRDGKIVAWANTVVGQSFLKGSPFEAMIKDGIDPVMVEGARELPYEIPDFRCDVHTAEVGVPTLWWRSVGHTHTGYAVECFVDELLQAAGQDPVAGRLAMMGKAPRARRRAARGGRAGALVRARARSTVGRAASPWWKASAASSRRSPRSRPATATGRACTRCGAPSIAASPSIRT